MVRYKDWGLENRHWQGQNQEFHKNICKGGSPFLWMLFGNVGSLLVGALLVTDFAIVSQCLTS